MSNQKDQPANETDEKSFFGIIVHSFFIVPFLIAVFCVLLFVAVRILTIESHTVYEYLEDVKTGGVTKRWQAAFELSKILANPNRVPQEQRFKTELIAAFEQSKHDNDLVRQYLALAMGRTGDRQFVDPLLKALKEEKPENLYALIYALGILGNEKAVASLTEFLKHENSRIRLVTIMALGNLQDPKVVPLIKTALNDQEPNVQWDAAVALAKLGDSSGNAIIVKLLDREYLSKFPEVDIQEQNHIMLVALEASTKLNDPQIAAAVQKLAQNDQNMKIRRAAMESMK